jgi:pimeloyl-ACP methyl ester carboxylesterase
MEEQTISGYGFICGTWPLNKEQSSLLFIHGSGGSSIMWKHQVESLQDRVNTIAIDLPGHGKSAGGGFNTVIDYTHAIIEFIKITHVPKPIPVGLSLGGAIVQQLLIEHSETFSAGVLINTGARLRVLPLIFETIEKNFDQYMNSMAEFAASEKTPPEKLEPLLKEAAHIKPEIVAGDFRACDTFDVMGKIADISVPVLIITAEEDKLTPVKYGMYLEEHIEKAHRVHIMDAGHLAPLEQPDEVSSALRDFLDRYDL